MSAEQKIITIDDISSENAPIIYVSGGLDKFFTAVKAEVTGEVPDLSTVKGRARIASLAAKVSNSKVAVEKPGREYLKRLKEMPKTIEVELAAWVKKMDALRDTTRKPLTDWEAAETKRKDDHIDAIDRMKAHAENLDGLIAEDLADRIVKVEAVPMGERWQEFAADAASAKDAVLITLRAAHTARQKHEAELAQIAQFNAEKAQREQKERDDLIAKQAAEKATRDAEERARLQREADAQRIRDDQAAALKRESDLKLAAAESERKAEQARREQVESEQRAEQDRKAAVERQAQAVERARLDEIAKQSAAADEVIRQQNLREADKAHKAKINRAALEAFVKGGMPEACAKQAVILIATHAIPAVAITY
ncbi:hypothetical protein [Pseudomonas sp. NA-150]|uniref:hypothetical protein n=1 Tax=Pseudomonas sp. NA-150 TaxID=3367525 RepID=UPI0037C56321